jgi:hypothetical protein
LKKGITSKVERKRNQEGIKRSRETTAVQGEREEITGPEKQAYRKQTYG